jgi:hypothetical protein
MQQLGLLFLLLLFVFFSSFNMSKIFISLLILPHGESFSYPLISYFLEAGRFILSILYVSPYNIAAST